jgi:hypothetical protein
VFEELFSTQAGAELYLRHPVRAYGLPLGTPLAWRDVAEVVRGRGETAVGVIREAGARVAAAEAEAGLMGLQGGGGATPPSYYWPQVRMGVAGEQEAVVLGVRDKLVVLAEQA